MSDIYGPLPVLHFGETENPYLQEECYMHFFETLDSAIAVLKDRGEQSRRQTARRGRRPLPRQLFNGSSSPTGEAASGHAHLLRSPTLRSSTLKPSRRRDGT
ncbi:MAG: SusD/RagB family nutrient-binding outer membrane lipoprotein [Alistipes sp.]